MWTPLEQATQYFINGTGDRPSPDELVNSLLQAEKAAKHDKKPHSFQELIGTWRLCFVTGTKKTRQRAGIVLGAGRYLPGWVKIYLSYARADEKEHLEMIGTMHNLVELGSVQLSVMGPAKFIAKTNILAFDFTRASFKIFGVKVYEGYIRGGKNREANFYLEKLKKQAFFTFFLMEKDIIAARGRGGGLALWVKCQRSPE